MEYPTKKRFSTSSLIENTIEELRKLSKGEYEERKAFFESNMFKYFVSMAFIRPAMKELDKLAALGKDVFNPKRRKSQISPDDAKSIIKVIKDAWSRKNASQMSRFGERAFEAMQSFEDRDKSVMG